MREAGADAAPLRVYGLGKSVPRFIISGVLRDSARLRRAQQAVSLRRTCFVYRLLVKLLGPVLHSWVSKKNSVARFLGLQPMM